jgi:hypothetical protein
MVTIVVWFGDIFAFDHPFRFGIIMEEIYVIVFKDVI